MRLSIAAPVMPSIWRTISNAIHGCGSRAVTVEVITVWLSVPRRIPTNATCTVAGETVVTGVDVSGQMFSDAVRTPEPTGRNCIQQPTAFDRPRRSPRPTLRQIARVGTR